MIMVRQHEAPGKEETHARYPEAMKIFKFYPFVLSAQGGLRERLERMEAYHAKAKDIAAFSRRLRRSRFELTVGEATLDLSDQEIVAVFQMVLSRVNA